MSKQTDYLFKKLFHTKHILIHIFIIILVWLSIFGIIQNISAQEWWWTPPPQPFSVIKNEFTWINIWNYLTKSNFWTIKLWASWSIDLFQRNRSWINTKLYDDWTNLIYFNNFDSEESLEENLVPLADSIRDFSNVQSWKWWSYYFWYDAWWEIELYGLVHNSIDNMRTIWTWCDLNQSWPIPITNYYFANIWIRYTYPWSWSICTLSWWPNTQSNNISMIRKRTSPKTSKVKILQTLEDNENNCWSWISYMIFTWDVYISSNIEIFDFWGLNLITGWTLENNFEKTTIEKDINIQEQENIYFLIKNNWNNECNATYNHIQIYDITNGEEISWPPIINSNGKYWWALEFNWTHQQYSLWTWVNQWSGITISARVKTNNASTTQAIVTKKNSYGIIIKDGKIWVSPSTYWMWHDTWIPITTDRTHITRTYDGQQMNVYKNGWSWNILWWYRSYNINWPLNTWNNLTFIGYDEINTERWRNGLIDEIRMYNTGLTSSQVQQLYESNLKIIKWENSYREFITYKTWLVDWIYNYSWFWLEEEDEKNIEWQITIDSGWPTIHQISWTTWYESNDLTINISWTDTSWVSWYQRRRYLDWQRTNRSSWKMNSGFTIPAKDEPATWFIDINVKDRIWQITNKTGTIQRFNTWPVLQAIGWKKTITWYIEDELTFSVIAIDTGSFITYQRSKTCLDIESNDQQLGACYDPTYFTNIPWETWSSYTRIRDFETTWTYKITASDSQWEKSSIIFTGKWLEVDEWEIPPSLNKIDDLDWDPSWFIDQDYDSIIKNWKIWLCWRSITTIDNKTYYNSTKIWNDYCIISYWWNQIVLWWYWINRNKTLFTLTGKRENPYLINPASDQFVFEFQNTNLTWFTRYISGTNNPKEEIINILDNNLLWLYNFDKVLIADSLVDFMPIQSGKNRSYFRRPRGTQEYSELQYNVTKKQRVIWTWENLYIDEKTINPGNMYGDAVLWRTSPINAKVLVEYSFELDPNSNQNCTGNWIKYTFKKENSIISTWEILNSWEVITDSKTINIKKSDSIYFEINSKQDSTCDITIYDIKVHQLPETNVATWTNQWTNIWANYIELGRYWWTLEFLESPQGQYVSAGTWLYAPKMSISLRAYKTSDNSPQTIIEKRWSYWLIISGNKLHVVDNYTLHNTQIEIPNNTWTHIGRSHSWQEAKIYINGNLEKTISVSNLVPNNNSTQIWYLYPHWQRIGMLDEIYIYSWAISSWHFATLYEHNLNKVAWDRWKWVSNTSWAIHEWDFNFIWTSTSYNWDAEEGTWEIRRDFNPPNFDKWTWIVSGSQTNWESTDKIIIFENQNILLSWVWLSWAGKAINTWSYERDIDNNWIIDGTWDTITIPFDGQHSRIIKRSVEDHAGNKWIKTWEIIWNNVIPPVFSWFVIDGDDENIITWNIEIIESHSATITRAWYDENDSLIENWFEWIIKIPWTGDIVLTWQTDTITIPAQDEPIQWTIEVTAKNIYDFKTISTANLIRTNVWPELNDPKPEYTWLVEKPITFTITGFVDTGNNLEEFTYQWYNLEDCNVSNTITWETNNTYTITKDEWEYNFSYKVFDKQLSGTCHDFVGKRETFTEWTPPIINIWNSWTDLEWSDTGIIDIWWSVAQQWTIGICTWLDTSTNYWSTDIWNDYCIIQTWWNQIVLWWYGVNRYNTLFNLTGTIKNPEDTYYILSSKTNPFETKIQNTHLTWFKRAISGTNNNTIWTYNIFDDSLLGLYNFDEILLADSLDDFTPIQTGKNRLYLRRKPWESDYTELQHHPESKQRIVSNPIQEFDWLFISKNKINPWYNYWDAVLGRTSPVSADIKIELNLVDDNSTCGDGITYKLFNEDIEISSGTYGNHTINTSITKDNNLYFRINSNLDNDCDTTNYRIKIYQRPETNIANNVGATPTFGINSWASYIQTGKFWWAVEFTENNKFINLGNWLYNTSSMSVSMRLYKKSDQANQTILIKTGSYGIAIFNNTLQVTNKTTQQRFDTQIEIPKDTWTHIWRSYDWSTIHIYINGKLEKSQWLQWSIAQSSNPTYIWYSPSNWQFIGSIDELYIYSWAISSWHFATLYEHNLNRTARDKRTWTSNTSWSINEWIFDFTGMVTSQNWTANLTWWEIRKDFNAPLFSWRSWEVNWNPDSTTGNTIEISWKFWITLSWIRDDKFWLWVDTWSYLRDIDDNGTIDATQETITIPYQNWIESRIIKATVEDQIGNMSTITWEIKRLDANPPTFSWFLWTTGFESEQLIVSRTWILPDPNTKIDWTITLPSSTITHENTWTTITIPAQDEPTTANISVKISDEYGFEMTNESTIQWINTWPTITDTVTEYSWVVEKLLVFNAAGIDTWSQLSYQRYNAWWCPINQTIIWATWETYSTRRDTPTTQNFSYQIFDSQGSWSCHNFTGIRDNQVLKPLVPIYTTWINLNWNNTIWIDITGTTIIHPWTKWICTISGEQTIYRANPQTIWNDYCIIQTWDSVNSRVVIWFNDININKTFFSITWTLFQQQRLLSPTSNLFNINIITNNLTWLTQTISWTNNTNYINWNIYTWLLAMYNFDRILLTDSQTDFTPIQTGKNRSYLRRPRWTSNFTDLQYDPVSQQRLVSRPIQEYDGMFIKSNTLNPGDDYGDIVLKRTSPFHSNIEINFNLSDAIASCGDGIKYEILKWDTKQNINSWSYGNHTIQTTIWKSESLFFKINSSWNNLCDTANYRIQIYQLPETNISQKTTFATNSWAQYTIEGKKWWAFQFTDNNQTVRLGTWLINTWAMSIAFWINPENSNWNQTIIQKSDSYGIALSNWTIHVTNKSTQQRFDTQIEIEPNKRTHIWRSYDWLNMKLYKNWQNIRNKYLDWSIWSSTNNTVVGYSIEHGQFIGKIDELYIYDYVLPQNIFTLLNQYNLNRTSTYNRSLTENKDAFSSGFYDWKFNYSIIWSNDNTWLVIIVDFNWPTIKEINWLTGRESQNLTITWVFYDSWSQFSEYQLRYIINQNPTTRSQRNNSSSFTITIPSQIEPIDGVLEIKTKDSFWHELISKNNISWYNTGPIISNNQVYQYIAEVWSNITFVANAIDEWSNLTYQRYSWHNCNEILISETNSTLTIGSNTQWGGLYSFKVFDNYQEPSICVDLTWERIDEIPFPDLTVYLTWDGKWWNITGNRGNLWWSQTWDKIVINGNKWTCNLTWNQTGIIYTRWEERQWNDSCLLKLDNNEYILLAFVDIHTWFLNLRTKQFPEITSDKNFVNLYSTIYIPEITNFLINRSWENTQWSWLINKTITGQDDNLIRKYSFDRIEITDSTQDFGKFKNEYSWNYFRDNWTTTWEFTFNPRTQSRIINEPLQDYEYIFISSGQSYPWSNKYGKIVYERESTVSWNIDIESQVKDENPWYCTTTDWVVYTIKKWNSYETSNTIYTKDLSDLTENSTTETTINSGEKLYFIIDSKNNNQCDKISFNSKIYFNPIHDFSASEQTLQISWVNYNSDWKYWWSYDFSTDPAFLNIGKINKDKNITFNSRIKVNGTSNQTIIYKKWSYWLTIKDWSVKVTTDEWRRHDTNIKTTSEITNWQRNHLLWTYDGTNMYIYINWEQTRTNRIVWYYPTNSNSTIIWRSDNHGQLYWSIDELQVRNKFITADEAKDIYNTHFRKFDWETWHFAFSQTGLADGTYTITWTINSSNIFTGKTIIDNNPPIIEFLSYTWNEWSWLIVSLTWYDLWTNISWFTYRYKIPNSNSWTNRSQSRSRQNSWNYITLEAQDEPIVWTIEIEAWDVSNNKSTYWRSIQRLNIPITTEPLLVSGYEWSTITFTASGYDPGGTTNTRYKRYLSSDCQTWTAIAWANQKTFTTGRNEPDIVEFSYTMFDAQWLTWVCSTATWIWQNIQPTAKDLYVNASWNYNITFNATGYDPGGTNFAYQRYSWTWCTEEILNQTWQSFTTWSEKSGTYVFSYHIRDAQWTTWVNNINIWRECQIATWYRPHINPMAEDFYISENTTNKIATWDRKSGSKVKDPEFDTTINAVISSWSKWYCQLTNNRISFQPIVNNTWTWFCELTLTDGNNRSTTIKAYALNIDTKAPITTITTWDYKSFQLLYNDTSTWTSHYKILTWVWNTSSCWTSWYELYTWNTVVDIIYTPSTTDYRTICYYSQDIHGNRENTKTQLFTQPRDAIPFNVIFSSNPFMNNIFEATITTNKACTGTLTWLNWTKILSLSEWINTITWNFTENNWQKTAYISLQTQNTGEIFTRAHTFTIDQTPPSTPIITEQIENNDYYIVRRSPSTDGVSDIKWYNYEINNQYTKVKEWFTDVTYLNILKSEVQYNSWISIKVQSQDNVDNLSQRSSPLSITIPQQQSQPTNINTKPNQFNFTKTTNAKTNSLYTSNEIVIWWLSANTSIPISLSTWALFINDTKINNNSWLVKNWDIIYIQLRSSNQNNDSSHAVLVANWISSTYTITTETKAWSTTSFLEELRKLLEQLQKEDTNNTTTPIWTDTTVDTNRRSAPHVAPNGKIYNLYKTIDWRYSSHNFIIKRFFSSLQEMKTYIDKNNPKK